MVSEIFDENPEEKSIHPDLNKKAVRNMFKRVKRDAQKQVELYEANHYRGTRPNKIQKLDGSIYEEESESLNEITENESSLLLGQNQEIHEIKYFEEKYNEVIRVNG